MARIRSLHPTLFTDEAYASLPMAARVLLTGIWTEADDHGVFEWKPLGLKMKVFPADPFTGDDMGDLIEALEGNDCIKQFTEDGKSYGLVRNFCKWQRPKKPTYRYTLPHQYRTYVGLVEDQSGKTSADGGGRMEEVGKDEPSTIKTESLERAPLAIVEPTPAAPVALSRRSNLDFGSELPSNWVPSDELCEEVKTAYGMTDDDIRSELLGFHAHNSSQGVLSKNWDSTFRLFCKRWKEHHNKLAPPRVELNKPSPLPRDPREWTPEQWEPHARFYARTGRWPSEAGPDPISKACLCPREILAKHEINPETGERKIPPRKVAAS